MCRRCCWVMSTLNAANFFDKDSNNTWRNRERTKFNRAGNHHVSDITTCIVAGDASRTFLLYILCHDSIYTLNTRAQYSVCVFINIVPLDLLKCNFFWLVGTHAAFYSVRARYLGSSLDIYIRYLVGLNSIIFDLLARKKKFNFVRGLFIFSPFIREMIE